MNVRIDKSWNNVLKADFQEPYFCELAENVKKEYKSQKVYPPASKIFNAFDTTPFDKIKVVIIGQDPYHGFGQANGMCFSVNEGVDYPPSLINIFKEIEEDLHVKTLKSGDLTRWAEQGVLLLNSVLTVRANLAGSHKDIGWQRFTDRVIKIISDNRENIVFLLWGNYAKQKGAVVDRKKHLVLESGHPSPLSAARGLWFGNKHFSKTNEYLKSIGIEPIDWR